MHCLGLHWLRVPERIVFKVAMLTFRDLHGTAPPYLTWLVEKHVLSESHVFASEDRTASARLLEERKGHSGARYYAWSRESYQYYRLTTEQNVNRLSDR